MKTRGIALFLIITILTLGTVSCSLPVPSEYVAGNLGSYNVPDFNTSKFKAVENVYRDYFVRDLPDAETLAELTATLYFENFHEKIDTGDKAAVTDALLSCYVYAIGDRYSRYRTPEEYESYDQTLSGEFYGIGVVVTYNRVEGTVTVSEVFPDGAAAEAGISVGDLIIGVDGLLLSDIGYNALIDKIRGENNTRVTIAVLRDGTELSFDAIRRKVVDKSVSYSIDENKIGYVKISSFKSNTADMFIEAIDYLTEMGARGIVYDLRSNPGGYLSAVLKTLSYIAPKGTTLVSFSNGYGNPHKDKTDASLSLPSVVLCNENTASAGELFVAAMRDFDEVYGYFEVVTVGATTYGKGIMQNTYLLSDGSTVTLTVAYYNPPSGVNYDGEGIEPDRAVSDTESGDPQLDAAYTEIYQLVN